MNNYLICIANTQNLISATRDAKNIVQLTNSFIERDNMFVIILGKREFNIDLQKDNLLFVNNKNDLIYAFNHIKSVINEKNNADNILITLSSHGYNFRGDKTHTENDGCTEYIMVGGDRFNDDDISNLFLRGYNKKINIYTIIDTCHSGTMLDLPFNIIDGKVTRENNNIFDQQIYCISACADNQTSAEDISNLGFGGGLISAFIDELYGHNINIFDISEFKKLHNAISLRLSHFHQKSILSTSIQS